MEQGVTFVDPTSTYIEVDVKIGVDTVIYPFTSLRGATQIGRNCHIGPFTLLHDVTVGENCHLVGCALQGQQVAPGTSILPSPGMSLMRAAETEPWSPTISAPEDLSPHYE
ncbi:MAG: hypothetical protein N3A60_02025 [Thermanaerothrix sp.]|nr:hypothetical protein [Thermanaerothrix sp.]